MKDFLKNVEAITADSAGNLADSQSEGMKGKVIFGIVLAFVFWFFMFAPAPAIAATIHNNYFWYAMLTSTMILSSMSLVFQRNKLKALFRFKWKYVWIGLIHAAILYGLSRLGVWLFTEIFTGVKPQVEAIYSTRTQADPLFIGLILLFFIGPAEEIFWRGFIEDHLMQWMTPLKGMLLTSFLYAIVHLPALNPMLLLAATVLGLHWGIIYMRHRSLVPGIISHGVWDLAIFVLFPITFN